MSALELRAPGADRLGAQLDQAADRLPIEVDAALADYGTTWLGVAAREAPRDSGRLAASHELATSAGRVTVTNGLPYAVPVHAQNPWLARARAATATDAERAVDNALDRVVNTIT